ncbi:MAG TPA: GAF domain-containing protein [Chryseolinea sp.]
MKLKLNLSNRISLGYIIIIAIALMATLYCVYTLQTNKELSKRIQTVNLPVYLRLKDLNAISLEAQKLINDWVYQPNAEEKNALLALQNDSYPKLRKNIQDIINHSQNAGIDSVKSVLTLFDNILGSQRNVMSILNADSLYSNDNAVDRAIDLYDHTITPASQQLSTRLDKLLVAQEEEINELQTEKETADTFLTILLFLMILVFVIAAVVAYFYARRTIIDPIVKAKDFIVALGQGKSVDVNVSNREDEIGEMMIAMRNLTEGINAKSEFALAIGQGKYDEQFALLGEEDRMGRALLDMRSSLKENAENERRRNWATQGLAEIGAILRDHTDKLSEFYNAIIRYVVKYMGANQGGIFLLVNHENEDAYLELMACYAYERKKIVERKLGIGEGLLGQCVLEKQTVNMRKLPENYIRITSGLGEAPPSNLVIVPLKINDEVQGVMEIASFHKFEQFQIDFLEKLGENIAASMAAVQINKRTQYLLDQSQQQGEQMKANQEELRQSMEELSATQEEMSRKESEYLKRIADLEEALKRKTAHTFQGNGSLVSASR